MRLKFSEMLIRIAHETRAHRLKATVAVSHVSYCGAVFVEGHGAYPVIAGVMGVLILVEFFKGEE